VNSCVLQMPSLLAIGKRDLLKANGALVNWSAI